MRQASNEYQEALVNKSILLNHRSFLYKHAWLALHQSLIAILTFSTKAPNNPRKHCVLPINLDQTVTVMMMV